MIKERVLVVAIGEHGVSYRNEDGTLVMGRFFGRDSKRQPIAGGEVVIRTARNANALWQGVQDGYLTVAAAPPPNETDSNAASDAEQV